MIPRCPTTTAGSVLIMPDYDAADTFPLVEEKVCQNINTVEDVPWKEQLCVLRPESLNRLYKAHTCMTDGRFNTTKQDQKTVDAAQVSFYNDLTSGGGFIIGKVWVEYDVELYNPQNAEDAVAFGGVGLNKQSGLTANSASPFLNNAVTTLLQEQNPVVDILPSTSFPGNQLFKFNRAWEGFIDKSITGTTLTDPGTLTRNGVTAVGSGDIVGTITGIINAAATESISQIHGSFAEGDIIGNTAITAASLAGCIINLGGSSVF